MKLSIIVPIYNVEQYLRECLESIVSQQVEDIEVILVDDGSKDQSSLIMEDFYQRYPNLFTCIHKPNGGLGDARNAGVKLALGEYIAFIDSDDFFADGALKKLLDCANHSDADIFCFDFYWYYSEENKQARKLLPRQFSKLNDHTFVLSDPSACFKIIRRKIYEEANITFPNRLWYEDLATTPAYALYTKKIAYLEEPLINYRQRPESIMSQDKYSPRLLEINESIRMINEKLKGSEYQEEMEYLALYQLCYNASSRFFAVNGDQEYKKCLQTLEELYPNWQKNSYYQRKPKAFRLYCQLVAKEKFAMAKLLIKLRGLR